MKERPISFSAPMVRAILDGTKTQTRRIAKWKPREPGLNLSFSGLHLGFYNEAAGARSGWVLRSRDGGGRWNDRTHPLHCPYGAPGDRLRVRETWCLAAHDADYHVAGEPQRWRPLSPEGRWAYYAATDEDVVSPWRPSIHMPRWASRITL